MANYSGNTGTIKIGADQVAELLDYTISTGVATIDNSTVSDTEDTHLIGTGNWSASISCFWDDTDTAGQEVMKAGDSITHLFRPSSSSGIFTGDATIEGLEVSVSRNNIVTASFTAKGDGALLEYVDGSIYSGTKDTTTSWLAEKLATSVNIVKIENQTVDMFIGFTDDVLVEPTVWSEAITTSPEYIRSTGAYVAWKSSATGTFDLEQSVAK